MLVHRLDEYSVVAGLTHSTGDLTGGNIQAEPRGQALRQVSSRTVVGRQVEAEIRPHCGVVLKI